MNVKSVEKLEKSQVAVTVEVTAEEFEAAVQKAYLKMRNKISVPGFRPGKAPRKMIEKLYGEGVFYSDGRAGPVQGRERCEGRGQGHGGRCQGAPEPDGRA